MIARYTDGTPVEEGDRIRYRQAPGGILPASGGWTYGVARKYPHAPEQLARWADYVAAQAAKGLSTMFDPDELHLAREEITGGYRPKPRTAYYMIAGGHIVERA